ncbi:hypothetical protein TWF281_001420 [Arthrobotrys megalospora]
MSRTHPISSGPYPSPDEEEEIFRNLAENYVPETEVRISEPSYHSFSEGPSHIRSRAEPAMSKSVAYTLSSYSTIVRAIKQCDEILEKFQARAKSEETPPNWSARRAPPSPEGSPRMQGFRRHGTKWFPVKTPESERVPDYIQPSAPKPGPIPWDLSRLRSREPKAKLSDTMGTASTNLTTNILLSKHNGRQDTYTLAEKNFLIWAVGTPPEGRFIKFQLLDGKPDWEETAMALKAWIEYEYRGSGLSAPERSGNTLRDQWHRSGAWRLKERWECLLDPTPYSGLDAWDDMPVLVSSLINKTVVLLFADCSLQEAQSRD